MWIYTCIMLAVCSIHNFAADAAMTTFQGSQVSKISESEFVDAFSQRKKYQAKIDTVISPQICKMVLDAVVEKIGSMDASDASLYNWQTFDSQSCTIVRFPSGLLAAIVYATHEMYEYWFFNESDYKFVDKTGTFPGRDGIYHFVSKNGYMATWNEHGYDSTVDISVYRLQDGGMKLISQFPNVKISTWNQVCWGDGNTFYIRGKYNDNDDEESPTTDKSGIRYLKFTISQ